MACAVHWECRGITSSVIRVDQDLTTTEQLFDHAASDRYGMATGAIEVRGRIWIGSFGPSIAVIKSP